MSKIVVIGSITFDLTAVANRLPKKGESLLGLKFSTSPGGKGVNQATTCQRLGCQTAIIGAIGDDNYGVNVYNIHKSSGLDIRGIYKIENASTGIAMIFLDEDANNSIICIAGANMHLTPKHINNMRNIIADSTIVMTQLEVPMDTVLYTLKLAKEFHKITILNPGPVNKIDEKFYQYIDYITPNETELEALTEITISVIDDVKKGARILLEKGIPTVIVTLGDQGVLYATNSEMILIPTLSVKAIDTVAAGDCFNGAFAVGLTMGKTTLEAIKLGIIISAITVTREGALNSLPMLHEVREFCAQKNIEYPF